MIEDMSLLERIVALCDGFGLTREEAGAMLVDQGDATDGEVAEALGDEFWRGNL